MVYFDLVSKSIEDFCFVVLLFRRGKDVTVADLKEVLNYLFTFKVICNRLKTTSDMINSYLYFKHIAYNVSIGLFLKAGLYNFLNKPIRILCFFKCFNS